MRCYWWSSGRETLTITSNWWPSVQTKSEFRSWGIGNNLCTRCDKTRSFRRGFIYNCSLWRNMGCTNFIRRKSANARNNRWACCRYSTTLSLRSVVWWYNCWRYHRLKWHSWWIRQYVGHTNRVEYHSIMPISGMILSHLLWPHDNNLHISRSIMRL